ncbi:hypothetical protein BOTBODRAFT_51491 [Botryobasidium botryosum FD-172 SS1]|uniref:Uncharacterized protein n=1 Tax=Botryobasidium botryosum (strain FD-172 SS1) TaxID=930990 RepID=A0A067MWM7_BOTB1|nr:hypothetical protein BOTBODRAFT_51491 [Botryobasidium botryosum FD-172 SS1]
MVPQIIDIICNDPDELEEFESLTDQEIRSTMGGFGAIKRIYRWKSTNSAKKLKMPHLFLEYKTEGSSKAAARFKHEGWTISYVNSNTPLYKHYLVMRKKPKSFAYWGPDAEAEQSSTDESSNDRGSVEFENESSPLFVPQDIKLGYSAAFSQSVPFTYTPGDAPQPTYTYPVFSPDPSWVASTKPAPPSLRRSRESEDDLQSSSPSKKLCGELGASERISLAQEHLNFAELESRAQTAEAKNTVLEDRVERLEDERKELESLLEQALTRELEVRESKAMREGELKARCDVLETQLEQVRHGQSALLKENEEMRKLVDNAYLVPALKDAFIQIHELVRGLMDPQPSTP